MRRAGRRGSDAGAFCARRRRAGPASPLGGAVRGLVSGRHCSGFRRAADHGVNCGVDRGGAIFGNRGAIEIVLPRGATVRVDARVDEASWRRVLAAMRRR